MFVGLPVVIAASGGLFPLPCDLCPFVSAPSSLPSATVEPFSRPLEIGGWKAKGSVEF